MAASYSNGKQKIETVLDIVKQRGLNTDKNVNIGVNSTPNLWVAGNVTVGGTVTATGGTVANVISGQGATATLTAAQNGSTVLFDRAAGIVYTLPAPVVGLRFTFIASVSVTSNNYKVITDAGTTLLIGAVEQALTGAAPVQFVGNGTTHISVLMNGGTTGGLQGTKLEFFCVNATQWSVNGWNNGATSNSTLFSAT